MTPTLKSLLENNWLAEDAVIVVEQSKKETFEIPPAMVEQSARRYGNSRITLLRYSGQQATVTT